jgi:DNA-binding NarL/FixJ family response regulator
MNDFSSESDLYKLAELLAGRFTLDTYKKFLIKKGIIKGSVLNEPYGRFSGIIVKEEFIRETLFFLWPDEIFFEFVDLLYSEGKLPEQLADALKLEAAKSKTSSKHIDARKMTNSLRTSDRKLRVFLCHASQDKSIVRELYQRLLAEGWIDPWLDEEKILPGQTWELEIEKAVEAADAVIVCISSSSVGKEGYIQKEIRKVLDVSEQKPEGTIFVIPLRLDDCQPPERLKNVQYADYFPDRQRERTVQRILSSLKIRINALRGVHSPTDISQRDDRALLKLSKQERYVLLLIAEGCTNREIATILFLSEGTVRNYVSSILSKLDVQDRAEAADFALKHRLRDLVSE